MPNEINHPSSALEVIKKLIGLQQSLLEGLKRKIPDAKDWETLLDFPKTGNLQLYSMEWAFQRHGRGISFTSSEGTVVDVHKNAADASLLDPWRLVQFCRSSNISHLTYNNVVYDTGHARIAELLAAVSQEGSGPLVSTDVHASEYRVARGL